MLLRNGVVVAVSLVAGIALSNLWRGGGSPTSRRGAPTETEALAASSDNEREQLRALLREELGRLGGAALARGLAAAPGEPGEGEPERKREPMRVEDAPRTEAQLAAHADAKQVLATRLAAGVWRREDERRWWQLAGSMNPADHAALRFEIIKAQNAERMTREPYADRPSGHPAVSQ